MGRVAISSTTLPTDSLAFALLGAAQALLQVRAGRALPLALANQFAQLEAPAQARGAIQDLAYRTLRRLGMVDALLAELTAQPPQPALLHGLLSVALGLLVETDHEGLPYSIHAVVDQAVRAAASDASLARAKGLVNAVLRRFLREREDLLSRLLADPVARWNYPRWWIDATQADYPDAWQMILASGNQAPPLTLRVNQRRIDVAGYLQMLATVPQPLVATQVGPFAVRLAHALPVQRIPGFADGLVSVQDAAAQRAAPLLDLQDGMRVLDACAAPGGKSGHILESATVDLLALDSDAQRLPRIEQNLQRLQLRAALVHGDARAQDWWDRQPFDRIVADVPCTASGIVRRHPDIRWLRRPEDAARLATLSAQILDNLWQMLKPGGKLLFITCSLWPQESSLQAQRFAERQQAMLLPAPGQLLPTATKLEDHDGLFYALFQKPTN